MPDEDLINSLSHHENLTYEKSYGDLDMKDKIVIDVGADCGSFVLYALQKGAKKIIAYENNPYLREVGEKQFYGDKRVEWHGEWFGNADIGDIFKMDCDGCEQMLSESMFVWLKTEFQQWSIAVHHEPWLRETDYAKIVARIIEHGGKWHWETPDGIEQVFQWSKIEDEGI